MMTLPAKEHATVSRQVKDTRNQAARGRRASLPGQPKNVEAVIIVAGRGTDERLHILAIAEKDGGRAYEFTFDGQTWGCNCFINRWRKSCVHVEAAALAWKLGRLPAVQEALQAKKTARAGRASSK